MGSLYALLVGIDTYPPNVPSLEGCVNDANAMRALLENRFGGPTLNILSLANTDATRDNVIRSFRHHLGQARPGDIAVFYYAGHGSQVPTGGLFKEIEPDGLNESLVCYDSRTPGSYDLVDKDLATLISEVTGKGVHLTAILDSCHSGGATRDLDLKVRQIPARADPQPAEVYLRDPVDTASNRGSGATRAADSPGAPGSLTLTSATDFVPDTTGLHVFLAACEDFQTAKEYLAGKEHHGAFTYFLVQTINATSQALGYEELMRLVRERLQARVADQTPRFGSLNGDAALRNVFLGLTPSPLSEFSIAGYKVNRHWEIDSGSLQSVAEDDRFALYPAIATAEDLTDPAKAVATAVVVAVRPAASVLKIDGEPALDTTANYKAVQTSSAATISVAIEGDDPDEVALLRSGISSSRFLHEGIDPRFISSAKAGAFLVTAAGSHRSLVGPLAATPQNARNVIASLEHMAKWTMRVELQNPSSRIPASAVQFTIIQFDNTELDCPPLSKLDLPYTKDAFGQPQKPSFRARITNRFHQDLYLTLLVFSQSWSISTGLVADGIQKLAPGETFYAFSGQPVHTSIRAPEATETYDDLLLIVSTDAFDAFAFKQPALKDLALGTRDIDDAEPVVAPLTHDFQTRRVTLRTTRPL